MSLLAHTTRVTLYSLKNSIKNSIEISGLLLLSWHRVCIGFHPYPFACIDHFNQLKMLLTNDCDNWQKPFHSPTLCTQRVAYICSCGCACMGPGKSLTATYARVEHLGQVAHAGVEVLRLNFECTPALSTVTGTAILRETVKPDLAVDDKMTQFLTRYLAPSKDAAKQVLTEEVFVSPTTFRLPIAKRPR